MFLIFGGECYYACGPESDLLGTTPEVNKAIELAKRLVGQRAIYEIATWSDDRDYDFGCEIEWVQVMDGDTGKVVFEVAGPYGSSRTVQEIRET
ncbi:MAG: hypothetical protein GY942_04160 [Aestuariibacter sp.]|nr:hypothetical protein [Aestuariibacter sp.]